MHAVGAMSAVSQSSITRLQISAKPPEQGPGFDGLDSDGDGGVTYEEFWRGAQSIRNSGSLSITSSVARTSIQAASSYATSSRDRSPALNLGGLKDEFDQVMAFINSAGAYRELSIDVSGPGDIDDDGSSESEIRLRALAAVTAAADHSQAKFKEALSGEAADEKSLADRAWSSQDPYERAARNLFSVADSDRDGAISREEFDTMKNALYGPGAPENIGASSITITARQGYSAVQGFAAVGDTGASALPGYVGLSRGA